MEGNARSDVGSIYIGIEQDIQVPFTIPSGSRSPWARDTRIQREYLLISSSLSRNSSIDTPIRPRILTPCRIQTDMQALKARLMPRAARGLRGFVVTDSYGLLALLLLHRGVSRLGE